MKWLLLVLTCIAGGVIETQIPIDWKYIFGYFVGTVGALIVTIID